MAFTEGPAADAQGRVFFSDIFNNRIVCFDSRSKQTTIFRADSGRTNGNLFDARGRLLSCEGNEFGPGGRRRITRTDMTTGRVEVLTDRFDGKPYNAPNDIAARSNGEAPMPTPDQRYSRREAIAAGVAAAMAVEPGVALSSPPAL